MPNKAHTEFTRGRAIGMLECGKTQKEVSDALGVSVRTLSRWYQAFLDSEQKGEPSVDRAVRRPAIGRPRVRKVGRPRKLGPHNHRMLKRWFVSGRVRNTRAASKRLLVTHPQLGEISRWTISRALHRNRMVTRLKRRVPLLNNTHKAKRLAFAQRHVHWTVEQWKRVIFSDETIVRVCGNAYQRRYWLDLDKPSIQTDHYRHSGGGSVFMWGCFGYNGVGWACRVQGGTLNAEFYLEILREELFCSTDWCLGDDTRHWYFMQDGAPAHTARVVKAYFGTVPNVTLLDWPASSPDLNPIENMWAYLKKRVYDLGPFRTADEVWACCEEQWNLIGQDYCQKLIESMPSRMQACIDSFGDGTRY